MIEADRVHSTPRADSPLYRTDLSPEQLQALGRLRNEAMDEIERLIAFLDASDQYVMTELELDGSESGIGDLDGLLEQVGTQDWQQGAMA